MCSIALGIFILMISVTESRGQVINELLKRMNDHNKALQSLSADVTMVTFDSVLKTRDTTTGSTLYVPEDKKAKRKVLMRLDWKTWNNASKEESLSVEDKKFTFYQTAIKTVTVGSIQSGSSPKVTNVFGFINMPRNEIRDKYEIKFLGIENIRGGVKTWRLQLTPKAKMSYKSADLWVDVNGMPLQVMMVNPNDDSTTILLSNIKKNITLKRSMFHIDYDAKSVKVVKR